MANQLAVTHFITALSLFIASGMEEDAALSTAADLAGSAPLKAKADACGAEMAERGVGIATAMFDQKMLKPLYARMLLCGARSGKLEQSAARLAGEFNADMEEQIDDTLGVIEPVLSLFLTLAVGLALGSVMLPLIGILGAIG